MSWANTSDEVLVLLEQTAEAVASRTGMIAVGRGGGGSLDQLSISAVIDEPNPLSLWQSIAIGTVLMILILCCVVGNFFVIMAILLERDLRSRPQYYLIFSLACADLLGNLFFLGLNKTVFSSGACGYTVRSLVYYSTIVGFRRPFV
jgi:hypothetical protein